MTDTKTGRLDTPGDGAAEARSGRGIRRVLVCGALASLLLCVGAQRDHAAAAPLRGVKVVWAGKHDAIIASDDSLPLASGDLITFVSRDKRVAIGFVTSVVQSNVALVGLGADSLKGVKRLDRLDVLLDESRSLQAPGELRLGYPAGGRSNLVFPCGRVTPHPPGPEGVYRTEVITSRRLRLVRNTAVVAPAPWPDTLLIHLFDDSADEEIAMERGDLDIAMFWPGEISAHARALWADRKGYSRTRGVLAAIWVGLGKSDDFFMRTIPDRQALWRQERELFGGEVGSGYLLMVGSDSASRHLYPDSSWVNAARFEVDHALPGWQTMERFLNTRPGSRAVKPRADKVRLAFLDAPCFDAPAIALAIAERLRSDQFPPELQARADSLVAETRAPGYPDGYPGYSRLEGSLRDRLQVELLIATCPLLWRSGLGRYVDALGHEALINLLDCSPAPPR